jgi:hypothetical protein
MKFRERAVQVAALFVLVVGCSTWNTLAEAPKEGDVDFEVRGTIFRDELVDRWQGRVDVGTGRYLTPKQRVLALGTFLTTTRTSGGAVGGGYEVAFWRSKDGDVDVFFETDAQATFGGVSSDVDFIAAGNLGVALRRGPVTWRGSLSVQRPIDSAPEEVANDFRRLAYSLGVAWTGGS